MGTSTTSESDQRHDAVRDVGVEAFRLAVILGNVPAGRHGAVVADWFIREVERRDELGLDVVDLAEVDLAEVVMADVDMAEVDLPLGMGAEAAPDGDPGVEPPVSSVQITARRPDGCVAAAQVMLDQLSWWAVTARGGRERQPYAA